MSNPIGEVKRAEGVRGTGDQLSAAELEKGALTKFDDGKAVFTGNGTTTPADVMSRLIALEVDDDPSMAVFAEGREAALYTASQALITNNPQLEDKNPESPVPVGEQFYANAGDDLKALLAPWKNNLSALRDLVVRRCTRMLTRYGEKKKRPTSPKRRPAVDRPKQTR